MLRPLAQWDTWTVWCAEADCFLRQRGSVTLGIHGSTQQVPRRPILPPGVPGSENVPIWRGSAEAGRSSELRPPPTSTEIDFCFHYAHSDSWDEDRTANKQRDHFGKTSIGVEKSDIFLLFFTRRSWKWFFALAPALFGAQEQYACGEAVSDLSMLWICFTLAWHGCIGFHAGTTRV